MAGNTPGPESTLTDDLLRKIKECILDGKNLKETAEICEIPVNTLYDWKKDNRLNINDKIAVWDLNRKLMKSERNLEYYLDIEDENDPKKMKIKLEASMFVAKTIGSATYSPLQKVENSGSIDIKISKEVAEKYNDINTSTIGDSEGQT
jgi:hypothetical protein